MAGAPLVLALGFLLVAVALYRLDDVYAGDPGVFRSDQLAPGPLAVTRPAVAPVGTGVRNLFAKSSFGRSVCDRIPLGSLCEPTPTRKSRVTETSISQREALERYARRLFTHGSSDVSVLSWDEGQGRIVAVTVARYADEQATRRALRASRSPRALRAAKKAIATPISHAAWPEGNRFLIGTLVTAPNRAAARTQLKESREDVRAYAGMSRFLAYEVFALGPVLLLFALIFGGRGLIVLAFGAFFAVFTVLGLVLFTVAVILYFPIGYFRMRRGREFLWRPFRLPRVRNPFRRRRVAAWTHTGVARVESLDSEIKNVTASNRSVMLVLALLVAVGLALLTTPLFPASLVWGSLLLVALYFPPPSRRGSKWIVRGRKVVRAVVVIAAVGLVLGVAPVGVASNIGFAIVVVGVAAVILVGHWRDLVTETTLSYAKWYEDIDARSSVFLAGVGLLTLAAAALFLGTNGSVDPSQYGREKLIGLAGLLVASSAVAYARAARDSAARERARRRATPPVLYLRSFGDDRLRVVSRRLERRGLERLSWRRTELFEDVVARALSTIGPVVAIARPGTGQRNLGAARDSIVADDWLAAVKNRMNEAVRVAVVMGASDGLVRELETLDELGLLDRVCIFVPPVGDGEVARRLDVLAQQVRFAELWGIDAENDGWRAHAVAMTTAGGGKVVLTAKKRNASAYRAAAGFLR